MEILASVFIIFVTVLNTLLPNANAPVVKGDSVTNDSADVDTAVDQRGDARSTRQDALDTRRAALEEARAARRTALEDARTRRDEAREDFRVRRDEFKEKLGKIKDERKRRVLERIAGRLEQINNRWTTHWDSVLSRLSEILVKIGTRADKLEENGSDVSAVRTAITDADAAIISAQDAVNIQAEKSYIILITDEESLKSDVQSVRGQLHDDLTKTRDVVKTARQAVRGTFQALKDVRAGDSAIESDSE